MARSRCLPRPLWLSLVLAAAAALPAQAADWVVARGPSHEPAPYRYDAARWKSVPREFLEDAPACVLYSGTTYLIEADGSVETVTHEIVRFNGRKGIEDLGEHRNITYDPSFEKLTLNEARVLKPDGRVVPVEPTNVHLRDQNTDYEVIEPAKELVLSLPNLEVDDTFEVKWTVRGRNPEYQGQFFRVESFGYTKSPSVLEELRVRLSRDRTLRYAAVNTALTPTVREEAGYRTYHWQATHLRPLPQDDDLPPREELSPRVAFSTLASWDEVDRWNRHLMVGTWECTPEIRRVVDEVTRGLNAPLEKARALSYWVRRHVRYLSVGANHRYTPYRPARVLTERYGDCKDQGQLLAVMLRAAGIPCAVASLGGRGDGQILESVPSPWAPHEILLVTLEGRDHWIDSTVSEGAWDVLPFDDCNRLCYLMDAEAAAAGRPSLRLKRTPPLRAADNRIEQTTRIVVAHDGTSHNERTAVYHGAAALAQRTAWLDTPAGERRRLVTNELQNARGQTRLTRLAIADANLRDFDKPVTARMEFDIPGHFNGTANLEGDFSESKLWNRLLAPNLDPERKVALDLGMPFELHHHFVVELPPTYRLDEAPPSRMVSSSWGKLVRTVKADPANPRRLDVVLDTRVDRVRVEPAEFEAFRKFQDNVTEAYRVSLSLQPARDLTDAPVLEAALAHNPEDRVIAVRLALLYLDKDKLEDARRVIEQAEKHHPQDKQWPELLLRVSHALERQAAADRAKAHYRLAEGYFAQGRLALARTHLEEAGKADRTRLSSLPGLLFQGHVYEGLHRSEDALRAYREALKSNPNEFDALAGCVRLAHAAHRRAEALGYLRRCAVAAGEDPDRLVTAADLSLRLGRDEDALDLAGQALARRPAPAGRVLGLAHAARGEHAPAVACLEKILPDLGPEGLEALTRSYLALGRLHDAARVIARQDGASPSGPGLTELREQITALTQRGEGLRKEMPPGSRAAAWETAVECVLCAEHAQAQGGPAAQVEALLARAFAGGVEVGAGYALRGQLALEKGQLTSALADAERGLRLSPQDARAHYVRGRVRLERGTAGALADLARAAELSQRRDAVVLHWLAQALFDASRFREALETQRAALKLKPGDREFEEQCRKFERHAATPRSGS
jgi:tetratricopeptide (TPR) repeat protein